MIFNIKNFINTYFFLIIVIIIVSTNVNADICSNYQEIITNTDEEFDLEIINNKFNKNNCEDAYNFYKFMGKRFEELNSIGKAQYYFSVAHKICDKNYQGRIKDAENEKDLLKIINDYNDDPCIERYKFLFYIGKHFYELNVIGNTKKYLSTAQKYLATAQKFSPRRYSKMPEIICYLILVALDQPSLDIDYLNTLCAPLDHVSPDDTYKNSTCEHIENHSKLKQLVLDKIKNRYYEPLSRFKDDPINTPLPDELIDLMNKWAFKIIDKIDITKTIEEKISTYESASQTKSQATNLLALYKKLDRLRMDQKTKLLQHIYRSKISQYQLLVNYYNFCDEAMHTPQNEEKCKSYTRALNILDKKDGMKVEDTENVRCYQMVACFNTEMKQKLLHTEHDTEIFLIKQLENMKK